MIATAGLTVYFVAGRCLEQTGSEKVRILIRSVYYSFVKPWTFRLWFGVLCDYCRNPIFKRNICVAFDFPDNSKEHLYLNNPHDFIIGHKKCLLKYQSDELKTMNTAEQERDYKASQKLQDLDEFSIWSNSMIPWHAKWRVHWAERRQKDLGDGSWYSELIHVRNRLGINQSFEASSNKHNLP
nr:hypothetical protein 16 [bacterium]